MSGRTRDAPPVIQRRMRDALAAVGRALVFLLVAAVTITGLAAAVLGSLYVRSREGHR